MWEGRSAPRPPTAGACSQDWQKRDTQAPAALGEAAHIPSVDGSTELSSRSDFVARRNPSDRLNLLMPLLNALWHEVCSPLIEVNLYTTGAAI
jgi:hypothetical protein